MKDKKINFDQSTLKILYYKYKELIIPSIIILICLMLIVKVIMPQIEELNLMKGEEKTILEHIDNLKKDLNFLSTLDSQTLDSQFDLSSKALPPGKDFVNIINSISNAATNSRVGLDDFSFAVGTLSTASAKLNNRPSLQINLAIRGDVSATKTFLKELAKALPLSEVTALNVSDSSSTIVTVFYYKPYPPIELNDGVMQRPLNKTELDMLNKLSNWQNGVNSNPEPIPTEQISSPSSDLN